MTEAQDNYVSWIRDAHAMEKQALTMLEGQAERIEHYPQLRARITQHIDETKGQILDLKSVLSRVDGGGSSMLKDAAGKITATAQAIGGMFASDEVVKGTLASYTFEHMEIESYRILIAAAEACGDTQSVAVYERILQQEQDMAAWLEKNSPDVVRQFLARTEADVTAQR